jgi:hypothetical protein
LVWNIIPEAEARENVIQCAFGKDLVIGHCEVVLANNRVFPQADVAPSLAQRLVAESMKELYYSRPLTCGSRGMRELQFRDDQDINVRGFVSALEVQRNRFLDVVIQLVCSLPLGENVLANPASTPDVPILIDLDLYQHSCLPLILILRLL